MKILHTEWSNGWGGQEHRILADALILTELGHEVTTLVCPEGGLKKHTQEAGLPFIERRIKNAFDLGSLAWFVGLLRRERYQVVNTHSSVDSWVASAAAKLARTPVLVRTRHLSVPVNDHAFNFVYSWPDAIVTTAETIRQRMIEVNRFSPERVVSIPTGIDLRRFDPDLDPGNIREELGLSPGDRLMTMVAVLRSWKRHEVFLEAAARLAKDFPELKVLVVGEGPRRPNIETKIRNLGLGDRAIMTGHRTDVPRLLSASEVCALTSESSEGVPQSVLQYMAMSKPVAATTAGGIPEVIEDGKTGLLCPINDSEALAGAITRLLTEPDLAKRLGQAARHRVEEKHGLNVMAEETLALYRRIYKSKTGRDPDNE